MSREVRIPGPDHPITVERSDEHVVVSAGEQVVADTRSALVLREANYPPVYYVPIADVEATLLLPSQTHTYCPYKGEADYHGIAGPDGEIADAIWFYPAPYEAVGKIVDHVAFYPDRVSITAS